MHFTRLTILNYGPFAEEAVLELDPEVTVLTGPNDVGKSSVLNLLGHLAPEGNWKGADEGEFNLDHYHTHKSDWRMRGDFGAKFHIQFSAITPPIFGNANKIFTHASGILNVAPGQLVRRVDALQSPNQGTTQPTNIALADGVRSVRLPVRSGVGDVIDLTSPTAHELRFLRLAFGSEFNPSAFAGLSERVRSRELAAAGRQLDRWSSEFLPAQLGLRWQLLRGDAANKVVVSLIDAQTGDSPLSARGSGVRSLITSLAHLLDHDLASATAHWFVLFDEPETHLHADAQHLLRRLLEQLGRLPTVQVVYATHSPAMINPLRPGAVRLLSKAVRNDRATTVIDNEPFRGTYLPVRTALGLTPADSLLYAAVTVIAEGATEVVGLPLLLKKLADAGVDGFVRVNELLPNMAVVDGQGSDFENLLRVSKAQGANPVLFLDGDMRRKVRQTKFRQAHPEIPVVLVSDDREFEQLLPPETYFQAVAEDVGAEPGQVTADAFKAWDAARTVPTPKAFTKRVDDWLESLDLPDMSKPATMRRAVELVDPARVDTAPLLDLVKELVKALS